jgi:hypothetical protein
LDPEVVVASVEGEEAAEIGVVQVAENADRHLSLQYTVLLPHQPYSLQHKRNSFSFQTMDNAAKYGHLDILIWLDRNCDIGCSTGGMDYACRNGHLEVVKWLHQNSKEGCTMSAMNWASRFGHLDIVKWLHINRNEGCTMSAMDYASGEGHSDIVKWLHINRNEDAQQMPWIGQLVEDI